MTPVSRILCIGTRGSVLARWQTEYVGKLLRTAWPEVTVRVQVISTQGDRVLDTPLPLIGGKGVFTAELEKALHEGTIDMAVHSLKDLPVENPSGLTIGAIPPRAMAQDALISRAGYTLATLPHGATVGSSSRRRAAQLLYCRPDIRLADIRGNVDTRIRKARDPQGPYDAIVLAAAGLERLEQMQAVTQLLPLDAMLPAPGQGALAVQCRDEEAARVMLAPLNHEASDMAVCAERAFLAALGGGCALPIAAFAEVCDGRLSIRGRVTAPNGSRQIDAHLDGPAQRDTASQLGQELAARIHAQGGAALLGSLTPP